LELISKSNENCRRLSPRLLSDRRVGINHIFDLTFVLKVVLVGHEATLPINLYLQVRDGSTPVINAISFLLIVGTSLIALANLYFSRKAE